MKKIVQLILLTSIINTTTTHCWEWSDIVPTHLSNWYNNWQIRRQEIGQVKELTRGSSNIDELIVSKKRMGRTPIITDFNTDAENTVLSIHERFKLQEEASLIRKYRNIPSVRMHEFLNKMRFQK